MVSEATPDSSADPISVPSENSAEGCIDSVMLSLKVIFSSNPDAARRFYALFDPDSGQQPALFAFEALRNFDPSQLGGEIRGEERSLMLQAIQELCCALEGLEDLDGYQLMMAFELFKARAKFASGS